MAACGSTRSKECIPWLGETLVKERIIRLCAKGLIIHVCRKRLDEPKAISWPKLRRQVLQDVRELKELLEHHQEEGLPEADLQVIRRGKALEYYSRHYGKVYKDQETPMSVLEALLGINQLLDEEAGGTKEPPPHNAEPFTRMLLRLFDGKAELPRDQMQKFLRGTGNPI